MPAPGLNEISTTTLRNRSAKKMPSHSTKQAKTMSAIAHGWKPSGEAADIPVKVAKEFHAADKGKKYGKGGKKGEHKESSKNYDRSGHFPGNPGFKREGKPPYGEYNGGAHAKQPKGKSIGNAPEFTGHRPNQSYDAELREHHGNKGGGTVGKHHGEVAHVGAEKRGTHLVGEGSEGHLKQPHGKGIGTGQIKAETRGMPHGGDAHIFRPPAAHNAHGFGHSGGQRKGFYRTSGHSGAHRIGSRGK
jgi:hypothetical protein